MKNKLSRRVSVPSDTLLACPFCGSPAEHESTVTQETVRCTLCPATMSYDGSGAVVKAMWNGRANVKVRVS
jgi:transcription elongation factor Elf1